MTRALTPTPAPAASPASAGRSTVRDWLFSGQVFHRRVRPVGHRFAYRVLFLRFPLSRIGELNNRWFSLDRFNLMAFHRADHGPLRKDADLADWARTLVAQHGIVADGEIELQCFPRVLGYAFKPVSFWFCYGVVRGADGRSDGAHQAPQQELRGVIAEVNNTFGERHCYVLGGAADAMMENASASLPNETRTPQPKETRASLKQGELLAARKAFHVSPFFPVEGGYQFRFLDTTREGARRAVARIDYGDAAGPLLLTSLSGQAQEFSAANVLRAWLSMPLFTFGVIARIHTQALRLWLKRVRFHRKPEPPAQPTTHGVPAGQLAR
jgi:uncharacterized protein